MVFWDRNWEEIKPVTCEFIGNFLIGVEKKIQTIDILCRRKETVFQEFCPRGVGGVHPP